MNVLVTLSVSDGYSYATEKSERDDALLSVFESIILDVKVVPSLLRALLR